MVTPESSAPSEFTDEADAPENVPDDQNDAEDSTDGLVQHRSPLRQSPVVAGDAGTSPGTHAPTHANRLPTRLPTRTWTGSDGF